MELQDHEIHEIIENPDGTKTVVPMNRSIEPITLPPVTIETVVPQ